MPRYSFQAVAIAHIITKILPTKLLLMVMCMIVLQACATQSGQQFEPRTAQASASEQDATPQPQLTQNQTQASPARFSSMVFYHFANAEITGKRLSQTDEYMDALQALEIGIKNKNAVKTSLADLKNTYKMGALNWTPEETKALTLIINELRNALTPYEAHLPSSITLGKISDQVEGGLPHTRGTMILFSQNSLDQYFETATQNPTAAKQSLKDLFLHELHHIMSRHNKALHNDYYALLGFKACAFSPPQTFNAQRLTNPDAPHYKHYAPLTIEEGDGVIPYLSVTGPYDASKAEGLGAYFSFGLLAIHEENGNCTIAGDKPIILSPAKVPEFFDVIGRNTDYIIHPEETLADNFIYLIQDRKNLANPEIPEKIRTFWAKQ